MSIEYKVKLIQDVRYDKTKGYASVLARVVELESGSEKKISGGNVVFSHSGAADVSKSLTNSSAKFDFEKDREDEKRLVKVYAEYTDPRGITADESIIVEIDAKKPQTPSDTRPKFTLFLGKPAVEPLNGETKFKFVPKLVGPIAQLRGHTVTLYLDDKVHPASPLTNETGEAFTSITLKHEDVKREIRVTARCTIDGKLYFTNAPQIIFVSAKDAPEAKWEFSHLDLDLKGEIHPTDEPDHHNFILKTKVEKFERRIDDHSKIHPVRLTEGDIYAVRYRENFTKELDEKPETDKNGFAEIEVSYEAEDRSKRMTFIAEVEMDVQDPDYPNDPTKQIKRKFVSNEYHETLPKKNQQVLRSTKMIVEKVGLDKLRIRTVRVENDKDVPAPGRINLTVTSVLANNVRVVDVSTRQVITHPAEGLEKDNGMFLYEFTYPAPTVDLITVEVFHHESGETKIETLRRK